MFCSTEERPGSSYRISGTAPYQNCNYYWCFIFKPNEKGSGCSSTSVIYTIQTKSYTRRFYSNIRGAQLDVTASFVTWNSNLFNDATWDMSTNSNNYKNTHIITYYNQSGLVLLTCSDPYTGPSPFSPNPGILTRPDPCLAHYAQGPHPFLMVYKTPLLSTQCPIMQISVGIQTIIPFWPQTPALAPMYRVASSTAILFRPLCQFPCLAAPPMTPMPSKLATTCLPGAVNTHMICLYPCLVMGSNLRSPSKLSAFGLYHTPVILILF
jgi:hypothetical protein